MRNFFLAILAGVLRVLAHLTLRRYKPMVVGITGNVGKTSTKEAIKTVLSFEKRVRASSRNFNNELGLPLVILGAWDSTEGIFFWPRAVCAALVRLIFKNTNYPEILVLEYGIDRPGDMTALLEIARPNIGVVTALGKIPVHVEFFPSIESIAREKEKLMTHIPATGCAILNADEESVLEMRTKTRAQVVTYGFSRDIDVRGTNFEETFAPEEGISFKESIALNFKLNYAGSFVPVRIPGVLGESQAYAALAASSVGVVLGMNLVQIAEALTHYKTPLGRLNVIEGIKGSIIIDDTYNGSPLATKEALTTLSHLKAKRKIAVLGDMLELGKYTLDAHEDIGRFAGKSTDLLITIGMRAKAIAESAIAGGIQKRFVFVFDTVRDAAAALKGMIQKEDLILIKASQGVRLEKITEEVMAHPENAPSLLVRQTSAWKNRPGLYD